MKGLMIFFVVAAFFCALFFGYIFVVGKMLKTNPTPDVSATTASWQEQSQKAEDLQQRQRDLMRQRQDRMRDSGR